MNIRKVFAGLTEDEFYDIVLESEARARELEYVHHILDCMDPMPPHKTESFGNTYTAGGRLEWFREKLGEERARTQAKLKEAVTALMVAQGL